MKLYRALTRVERPIPYVIVSNLVRSLNRSEMDDILDVGVGKKEGLLGSILDITYIATDDEKISVRRTWKSVLYPRRKK